MQTLGISTVITIALGVAFFFACKASKKQAVIGLLFGIMLGGTTVAGIVKTGLVTTTSTVGTTIDQQLKK